MGKRYISRKGRNEALKSQIAIVKKKTANARKKTADARKRTDAMKGRISKAYKNPKNKAAVARLINY